MTKKGTLTGMTRAGFFAPKGRSPHQEIPKPKKVKVMFEITSTATCKYCKLAKEKLTELGLPYRETLLNTPEKKHAFVEAGFTTVPQIWRNGLHIGGHAELLVWLEKNHSPAS